MKDCSFRKAVAIYVLLFLALTYPYWLLKEVIAPDRQRAEIAAPEVNDPAHIENDKFGDFARSYIPELNNILNGPRSGWIALWSNQNELGRPIFQASTLSPTYLPTWLITSVTDNPYRVITVLSLGSCFLAGFFVMLFCRELELPPLAGLLAAGSLASTPLLMYWLTFPMIAPSYCWAMGAIYAVKHLSRRIDLFGWCVLAFSIYSLLLAGRKQIVVADAYLIGGYFLHTAYRRWSQLDARSAFAYTSIIASAVAVGALLALPMFIDVMHMASQSSRTSPAIAFFADILPEFNSAMDIMRFLALGTYPEIFGNPAASSYPFIYDGLSLTSLVVFLAILGALLRVGKTWGWWLAVIFFSALTFIRPVFEFAVHYLGFNLSRSMPLGGIILPITIVAAYGADALINRRITGLNRWAVVLAALGAAISLPTAVAFGYVESKAIHWGVVVIEVIVIGLLVAQYDKARPIPLIAALAVLAATVSYPLMLRQDPGKIAMTSPLVQKIRSDLPPGSRYAIADPGLPILTPNINASLGLASVHSYDSLSSRRYHALIEALGGKMQIYGRWNVAISPDYTSPDFWISNIGLILSPSEIVNENLKLLEVESGIYLYKVASRMGDSLQVMYPYENLSGDSIQQLDPRQLSNSVPLKTLDKGDLVEYEVTQASPSILLLSQQYHRDWRAEAYVQSHWLPAETAVINNVFQGILLPQGTQRVRLEFTSYARYAWVGHVFWLILLGLVGIEAWRKKWGSAVKEHR